jgi:type 1 glutamine amidotransferase
VARCARYDVAPPRLAVPKGRPRVLLFEKINGYRDSPSVDGAHAAFVAMAARKHWGLVTTDKGSAFAPAILRRFDVVIWNNISGDVLTLTQRAAFRRWMEQGGGFVGVHGSAGDPVTFWDWYVDDLIGARFTGHPMAPQFQTARVKLEDPAHPAVQGLPATWDMTEEWYSFKASPRGVGAHILATLDETTYQPVGINGQDLRMGDHPMVWTRCIGKGRMFYSAIGHRPEHYVDPLYVRMLEQAVGWSAGVDGQRCR